MELDAHLAVIASEAARMVAVAEEAGLDAKTPTCPTWNIRKLVLHTGEVHRWATALVAGKYTVKGSASDILMALWNRPALDDSAVTGDASLFNDLGANVRIRWS